jgi:hypothetical protein
VSRREQGAAEWALETAPPVLSLLRDEGVEAGGMVDAIVEATFRRLGDVLGHPWPEEAGASPAPFPASALGQHLPSAPKELVLVGDNTQGFAAGYGVAGARQALHHQQARPPPGPSWGLGSKQGGQGAGVWVPPISAPPRFTSKFNLTIELRRRADDHCGTDEVPVALEDSTETQSTQLASGSELKYSHANQTDSCGSSAYKRQLRTESHRSDWGTAQVLQTPVLGHSQLNGMTRTLWRPSERATHTARSVRAA